MSNDENREKNEEKAAVPVQPIIDMGSTVVKNSRGTVHCLTIVGQVEGHTLLPDNLKSTKYEHVLPLLAALEQNEQVDGVLLLLNTVGGDIEAGLAIAELAAGMTKPVVTLVLGGGHSIGVPLAVCGKETFIAPTASMTVHPVRMSGTVIAAPETYRYFERLQDYSVRGGQQPRDRGTVPGADALQRRHGQRRGDGAVRRAGGGRGYHRPDRYTGRCAGCTVQTDRTAAWIDIGGGRGLSAFFMPARGFFLKNGDFHSILS